MRQCPACPTPGRVTLRSLHRWASGLLRPLPSAQMCGDWRHPIPWHLSTEAQLPGQPPRPMESSWTSLSQNLFLVPHLCGGGRCSNPGSKVVGVPVGFLIRKMGTSQMRKLGPRLVMSLPKSHSWEVALDFSFRHYDSRAQLLNSYTTVLLQAIEIIFFSIYDSY